MGHDDWDARLVTVYVTHGMLRANVIKGLLDSAEIPCMLSYEAAGPAIGLTVDGLGRVEIRVPAKWAQEARDLLEAKPVDITDHLSAEEDEDEFEEEFDDGPDTSSEGAS
jgi:hypothetical protein